MAARCGGGAAAKVIRPRSSRPAGTAGSYRFAAIHTRPLTRWHVLDVVGAQADAAFRRRTAFTARRRTPVAEDRAWDMGQLLLRHRTDAQPTAN